MFTPDNDRDQLLDIESAGSITDEQLASDIQKQGIEVSTDICSTASLAATATPMTSCR